MTDLEKLATKYVDEKSDTDGFYDAFIAGYKSALSTHDVSGRQFEEYARFCIECDRQGLKPIKYEDYLKIG